MTLVTVGPLTNVAAVFRREPGVKAKVEKLCIMGGAVRVGGNVIVPGVTDHLKNKTAEWNIYIDPVAAQEVLNSGVPIRLIPLDATCQVVLTKSLAAQFKRQAKNPRSKIPRPAV